MKCCVKSCGLERPLSEMRPHLSKGRRVGYRCADRHGWSNNHNVAVGKATLKCFKCGAMRPRDEMQVVRSGALVRYRCKDKCAKSS